jgi:hypothetical protein
MSETKRPKTNIQGQQNCRAKTLGWTKCWRQNIWRDNMCVCRERPETKHPWDKMSVLTKLPQGQNKNPETKGP